jgi:hypothetical protein
MDVFHSLAAARLIFILGVVNLVTGLLVYFSCRCLPGSRIGLRLMRFGPYRSYYRYHCFVWAVFWPSVVVHAFFAIMFYGWPG